MQARERGCRGAPVRLKDFFLPVLQEGWGYMIRPDMRRRGRQPSVPDQDAGGSRDPRGMSEDPGFAIVRRYSLS